MTSPVSALIKKLVTDHDRAGAKQPDRFNPERAARLDDPARFAYLAPAAVLALLELGPSATLVDFGAGTGTYAVEFARARPDIRIFALDEQAGMLELMQAKLATAGVVNVEPIDPGRARELSGSADRILALNVLHELGDAAVSQMRALFKPNGFALFIDWNADVDRPHGPPNDHVYGTRQALQRLQENGFSASPLTPFAYHYAIRAEPRSGA